MNRDEPLIRIIDDEAEVRSALALLLECDGRRTVSYAGAEEFLRNDCFGIRGCVLSDVKMPGMSGLDLQNAMAERGIVLPLVFITGHGDIEMAVDALHRGAVDFLVKPVKEEKLFRSIEKALRFYDETDETEYRRRISLLSAREKEILRMLLEGLDTHAAAERLGIGERTVQGHRWRVYQKIGLNTAEQIQKTIDPAWLE